jgi:hypothetical protein
MTATKAREKPDREASLAMVDPWRRLAAGIVLAAVRDLARGDPVERMDAALWFMSPGSLDLCDFAGVGVVPVAWIGSPQAKKACRKNRRLNNDRR